MRGGKVGDKLFYYNFEFMLPRVQWTRYIVLSMDSIVVNGFTE